MRFVAALLLAAGFGCAARPMNPEEARAELARLPGGNLPVQQVCRAHSRTASQRIPIQFRDELGEAAVATALAECTEVLTVFVSVAMVAGDTTEAGLQVVRERITGAGSQELVDRCDEHYRAWQILASRDARFRITPSQGSVAETRLYDGWMDRCFRVLRPLSRPPA